jgi:hypothetical protein
MKRLWLLLIPLLAVSGCGVFSEGPWDEDGGVGPDGADGADGGDGGDPGQAADGGDEQGDDGASGCSEPGCSWTDPGSGLTWTIPTGDNTLDWTAARDRCDNLDHDGHQDWQLPSISELRKLIRGCSNSEPTGSCAVTDDCRAEDSCWVDVHCGGCADGGGPAADGCYWPEELEVTCGWYWSSSERSDNTGYAWGVHFSDARVLDGNKSQDLRLWCVRDGG